MKEPRWLHLLDEDRQEELRQMGDAGYYPKYDLVSPQIELLMQIVNLLKRKE